MADQIIADYGKFRVVSRPPTTQYGDSIFVQGWGGSAWKDLCSFNTLSDDYAWTNARENAQHRQHLDETRK